MAEYRVTRTVTVEQDITVEASSEPEAIERAKRADPYSWQNVNDPPATDNEDYSAEEIEPDDDDDGVTEEEHDFDLGE